MSARLLSENKTSKKQKKKYELEQNKERRDIHAEYYNTFRWRSEK